MTFANATPVRFGKKGRSLRRAPPFLRPVLISVYAPVGGSNRLNAFTLKQPMRLGLLGLWPLKTDACGQNLQPNDTIPSSCPASEFNVRAISF